MSTNKQYISIIDIVTEIKEAWHFGLQKWKIIVVTGLIGGLLGFLYANFSKPIYTSSLSFLLNENESSTSLSLSSLANITGIGGLSGGTNINEDKLLFIANSRYMIGTTMLSEHNINGKNGMLINHYIDIYDLQSKFKSDTVLKDFTYFTHHKLENLSYQENKVLDKIVKIINEDNKDLKIEAKKKPGIVAQGSGIIVLSYSSINEIFSKLFLDELYTNLTNYYIIKATQKQYHNYELIKHRADSLKDVLTIKENSGAGIFDRNINLAKMTARVGIERSRRDVEILNLMYAEVLKNMEVAKFALENQTPVFQIIDAPSLPLKMKRVPRIITAFITACISGFLMFFILFFKINYLKSNNNNKIAVVDVEEN